MRAIWRELPHAPDAETSFCALFGSSPASFWLDSSLVEAGRRPLVVHGRWRRPGCRDRLLRDVGEAPLDMRRRRRAPREDEHFFLSRAEPCRAAAFAATLSLRRGPCRMVRLRAAQRVRLADGEARAHTERVLHPRRPVRRLRPLGRARLCRGARRRRRIGCSRGLAERIRQPACPGCLRRRTRSPAADDPRSASRWIAAAGPISRTSSAAST